MKLKYTYYDKKAKDYLDYNVYIIKENNIYEVWIGKKISGLRWFCFGVEELDTQMLADLDDYCRIYEELYENLEED